MGTHINLYNNGMHASLVLARRYFLRYLYDGLFFTALERTFCRKFTLEDFAQPQKIEPNE